MTDGLKQIEGQIASIDYENRHFALEDRAGIIFLKVTWTQKFDQVMRKQKIGFYEKPTVCMLSDTSASLEDIQYVQRPADWPRVQGKGKQYQPRNERLIVFQTAYKECCETMRVLVLLPDANLDEGEYNRLMDMALARSIKDAKVLIEAAGGA